jgi:ATP-dependent Zn protease
VALLRTHKALHEAIAAALLQTETIDEEDLADIVASVGSGMDAPPHAQERAAAG